MNPSIWIRIQRRQEEYHQRCMEALICGVSKFDYKVIEGTCTRVEKTLLLTAEPTGEVLNCSKENNEDS